MKKQPCVDLLASGRNGTLYCGVADITGQQSKANIHASLPKRG